MKFTPPPGLSRWPPVDQWDKRLWAHWLTQHGWSAIDIEQYYDHDRFFYGLGITAKGERARVFNAHEPGTKWLYLPTPKGISLHATRDGRVPNTLWGGAAGGTKSMSARWEAIDLCLFPFREDVRVIFVRRELEELRRTHLDKIEMESRRINDAFGRKVLKVTTQPPVATFEVTPDRVAKIIFAHCQNLGDEEKYLSEDYDLAVIDESTRLHWKQIVGFMGRLRNDPKVNQIARIIKTTNPGGPSHDEHMRHYIEKSVTLEENEKYDPADYQFIQAQLYDNPYYMDPDGTFTTYEKRLYMYDPDRRAQLLRGDWGAIVNQFFVRFNPDLHVRGIA